MSIKKELGSKIKQLRKQHKYTQEKFAEMIDIAPRTLYGIESGKNFVTAETLEKIAFVLKISLSDLFAYDENISSDEICKNMKAQIDTLKNDPQKLLLVYKILKNIMNM